MGRTYQFDCPKCEYRTRVSGGRDAGLLVKIQTIQCTDCKALYDAVIAIKQPMAPEPEETSDDNLAAAPVPPKIQPAPSFAAAVNRLPPPNLKKTEWVKFPLACPVAPLHKIKPWKQPGKCPRCGIYLEPGALPYRLWD